MRPTGRMMELCICTLYSHHAMLVDEANHCVQSGSGGDAAVQFSREKYVPFGGPAGGDGGKGGSVILEVDTRLNTLSKFQDKSNFKAASGANGQKNNRTGASANDLIVGVPPGTVVRDTDTGELIADLT